MTKRNGTIVIESDTPSDREEIKNAIEEKIGEDYEIRIPKKIKPRLLITGMQVSYSDDELIGCLSKQNDFITLDGIKVVKLYEVKRNDSSYINAVVEVEPDIFTKCLKAERLNVGCERCKVYDGVDIMCCFKCREFGHRAVHCKNDEVCTKCHANHKSNECLNSPVNKCINCIKANNKLI